MTHAGRRGRAACTASPSSTSLASTTRSSIASTRPSTRWRALPDFVGVESWQSSSGKRRNATYFWRSLDALKSFAAHPAHQEAKRKYSRWYEGYHIVVSEIVRSYGDGAFDHVTPNERRRVA
jgi:heme-degrading monooxygenase HmoA